MSTKANRMFSYVSQTYLFLSLGLKFVLGLGVDSIADFKMFNFEFTTLKVAKIVSSDLYFEFRIDIT